MSVRRGPARMVWAALLVSGSCSPWGGGEVQAAEPSARSPGSAAAPAPAPVLQAPRSAAASEEPPPAAPPQPDQVADLAQLVARLEAEGQPALLLAEADLLRLLADPRRRRGAGLLADLATLDVVGDADAERVAVVSEGWFGTRFWVCLLEPEQGLWRLVSHVRLDEPCRGLPRLSTATLEDRRWIAAEWTDVSTARARAVALALLEPVDGHLRPVLRVTRDGFRPGGPRTLSVSHQLAELSLEAVEAGVELRLAYGYSAGAAETGLGDDLWVGGELTVRLGQPAAGEPFAPLEPAGVRTVDAALFETRACADWLREHAELTGRLALEGEPRQQLVLLELVEGVLQRGGSPEARSLLALLPARAELEAAVLR